MRDRKRFRERWKKERDGRDQSRQNSKDCPKENENRSEVKRNTDGKKGRE